MKFIPKFDIPAVVNETGLEAEAPGQSVAAPAEHLKDGLGSVDGNISVKKCTTTD